MWPSESWNRWRDDIKVWNTSKNNVAFYSIRYAWCGKKEYQRSYKKTTLILFSAMISRCWIRASLFETGLGKYVKYTYQFNAALKKIAFQSNSNITPSGSWTRVVLTNVNISIYNTCLVWHINFSNPLLYMIFPHQICTANQESTN